VVVVVEGGGADKTWWRTTHGGDAQLAAATANTPTTKTGARHMPLKLGAPLFNSWVILGRGATPPKSDEPKKWRRWSKTDGDA
jgi:hypothetical protein